MLFQFLLGVGVILAFAYHFSAADIDPLAAPAAYQALPLDASSDPPPNGPLGLLLVLHNRVRANTLPIESLACARGTTQAAELVWSAPLSRVAQKHADWMAKHATLSHGSSLSGRVKSEQYAYRMIAENIAKAQLPAGALMQLWLNSTRHCNNILNPAYQAIGIGKNGQYWSVVLAKPA